jgi:hypothetical protein
MIEAHDVLTQDDDTLDYTQRAVIGQNEDIKTLLAVLNGNVARLANFSARQLESRPPSLISLGSDSGKVVVAGTSTFQTTVRFRVSRILISSAANGDVIKLSVGFNNFNFLTVIGTNGFDFPIEIDRGMDITVQEVTNPAATYSVYIFGYPE